MKSILSYSLLAGAMAAGVAVAQPTTATTKPVGYVTETIKAGQFNLIGLTVQQPTVRASVLTGINSTSVSDTGVDFTSLLTAGQTYVLKITDGPGAGTISEVVSWNANSLTTVGNLTTAGVANGAKYQLRKAATLSDVFGASNAAGLQAGTISTADIVWIPTGGGNFAKYFYSPAVSFPAPAPAGWKNTAGVNSANVPIVYADSIFIQRRGATDLALVVSGEVETSSTSMVLEGGVFNYVGGVYPAGSTLGSSNLASQVQAGTLSTGDLVWVPDGLGGYAKYYYSPAVSFPAPAPASWKSTAGTDATNAELKSGIIIQRRGATKSVVVSPPASYGNL